MPDTPGSTHPLGPWLPCRCGTRLRCGIVRLTAIGAEPATAAAPDDLVLVVEMEPSGGAHELRVELYRGDDSRDVWQRLVGDSAAGARLAFALRLLPSGRPERSSRLSCRIWWDGAEVARRAVLLVGGAVDAQGRLARPPEHSPPGPVTALAVLDALRREAHPDTTPMGNSASALRIPGGQPIARP